MSADIVNTEQAEYWNGEQSSHWVTHQDEHDAMLEPFTPHLLASAGITAADRVLDIGCGCGATTLAAARVATGGTAHGVDISRPMLVEAERKAQRAGLTNITFEPADVQVHEFTRSFDVAISRFGVMFFADPVAAFANIASALRPGGRLAMLCWAALPDNEWTVVPAIAAAEHITLPEPDPTLPNPFAFADQDHVAAILAKAGFEDVSFDAVHEPLRLGADAAEAVGFLSEAGPGKRMLAGVDEATAEKVVDAMICALEPFQTPDGLKLGSKAWLVTATR